MGLARSFCDDDVLTVNYPSGTNSDSVKKGFLAVLTQIR